MSARNLAKVAGSINDDGSLKDNGLIDISHSVTTYDSYGSLPREGLSAGQQAFTLADNTLFITDGILWYRTAIVNLAPQIQSILNEYGGVSPFSLSSLGADTTITIIAVDSDGPITYNATADSDFNGLASISQSNNVFIITPFSEDSAITTSGTITFKVTDGVNIVSSGVQTFTLVFMPNWAATTQQAKIQASDAEAGDEFGVSAAIEGDTLVVGAFTEDTGASDAGAAYIFTRSGSTWTQQQKIQASDIEASARFGGGSAIEGDTLVVGAHLQDTGATNAGAAYIFTRSGSTWTQQQKIQASDPEVTAIFGFRVGLSGDTIVAGARLVDTGASDAGAAYIFTRSGSTWTQQQKIQASDIEASAGFGASVAIDGDTVVAGAYLEDNISGTNAGSAYIFTRSGSTWTQQQKLLGEYANDQFGDAVAIEGDTVVVGALGNNNSAGAAYIFTRSGSTWTQQAKLTASDTESSSFFGASVAIDGDTVVVGAYTAGDNVGAAYIFTRDGSTWTEQAKLTASDAESTDYFGRSVGLSGDTVVVGAIGEDTGGNIAGAAYAFVAG